MLKGLKSDSVTFLSPFYLTRHLLQKSLTMQGLPNNINKFSCNQIDHDNFKLLLHDGKWNENESKISIAYHVSYNIL